MGRIVHDHDQLSRVLRVFRTQGKSVVFTAGAFDLLRVEHVRGLTDAASRGHYLVVGVTSDAALERRFGKGHPFQSQKDRAEIVSVIDGVDYVTIFDDERIGELMNQLRPSLVAYGRDLDLHEFKSEEIDAEWLKLSHANGQSYDQLVHRIHTADLNGNGRPQTSARKSQRPAKSKKGSKAVRRAARKVASKKATKRVVSKAKTKKKKTTARKKSTGGKAKRARRAGA